MLLDKLVEYQKRSDESLPPGYQRKPVPWIISLDASGVLQGIERTSTGAGSRRDRGRTYVVPDVLRASGIRPILLVDRADYALGLLEPDAKEARKKRVPECHRQFVELVEECAAETNSGSVRAVLAFLRSLNLDALGLPEELSPSDIVAFDVAGGFPHDLDSVKGFWARRLAASSGGTLFQCLVCGQLKEAVDRHPIKIKGIPGGQTSGMSLVSANAPAFESYGLEASLISPICRECAEGYANGMNALISGENTHLREGETVYVFWTRSGKDTGVKPLLFEPDAGRVQNLLSSAYWGREPAMSEDDLEAFYATALSASGGRVVVRDWLETTLARARYHLARYFLLQGLGPDTQPFSIGRLRRSLDPPSRRRVPGEKDPVGANITRWLIRCALLGEPLPDGLLYQAVRRNRAEQRVASARAALIKMVLLRNQQHIDEEGQMDIETRQHPAYLCGRLLALLEIAQRRAIRNLNASIVDRNYGAASASPAYVFPMLMKNARHHFAKFKEGEQGLRVWLESQIGEVCAQIGVSFPRTFSLEEQGRFALGYYYQRWGRRDANAPEASEDTEDQQ
ncbi:MAG: type I-C CRISPR-associated protein Cas8c/Csd1 [Chloroflexi bacterium]|nr:type I-C CRISPR-associated protein Cas8c/Csd1 [Chloroflexota bacterium]